MPRCAALTGLGGDLAAVEGVDELAQALLVAVHLPVPPHEELPGRHSWSGASRTTAQDEARSKAPRSRHCRAFIGRLGSPAPRSIRPAPGAFPRGRERPLSALEDPAHPVPSRCPALPCFGGHEVPAPPLCVCAHLPLPGSQ